MCMQKRSKWVCECNNVAVGDLVLLIDVNSPRGLWALGTLEEVFPGDDGLVRTVRIRIKSG